KDHVLFESAGDHRLLSDQADELPPPRHPEPPETELGHPGDGVYDLCCRVHGGHGCTHHLPDLDGGWVQACGDHLVQDVPLGDDPDRVIVAHHDGLRCPGLLHHPSGVCHRIVEADPDKAGRHVVGDRLVERPSEVHVCVAEEILCLKC